MAGGILLLKDAVLCSSLVLQSRTSDGQKKPPNLRVKNCVLVFDFIVSLSENSLMLRSAVRVSQT